MADDTSLSRAETWALIGCQPLAQLSNQALLPSLGALRVDLNLSYFDLGWIVAAFGIARLVVDLPAGSLASRWNPRTLLIVALALSGVGSAAGIVAQNGWQLALVRLVIGVGSAIAQAMLLAWIVGGAGRAGRGRVLARSEAFFSVVGLIVPALGGLLANQLSWRVAFVLGAGGAALALLAIVFATRPSSAAQAVGLSMPSEARVDPAADPGATRWRDLRLGGSVLLASYLATFIVFYCRNGMLNAVVPVVGAERFSFTPFEIGLLFSVLNALGIGAVLLAGRCADRFGRYRVLVPSLALLTLAQGLLLIVNDPATYIVVGLVQGLAAFVNPIPTIVMGDALPARLRARGIAVYRAVCDVAILSAPASMGVAIQLGGFDAAESVNLLVSVVVLGSVWWLYSVGRTHDQSDPRIRIA